jgi:hypothetical protein
MSKPVLTFVKMMGCPPCNNFFGSPNPEKSQWAELVKDPELNKIVQFSLVEWGFDKANGNHFKKPAHLEFVNYGPGFVLVDGVDKSSHLEYNKSAPKTAAGIKKWILENYKQVKTGAVSGGNISKSAPAAPKKVATKVAAKVSPKASPVKAKAAPLRKTGAPKSFVPATQLPHQLRHKAPGHPMNAEPGHISSPLPAQTPIVIPPQHQVEAAPQLQMQQPIVVQQAAPSQRTKVSTGGLRLVPRNKTAGRRR